MLRINVWSGPRNISTAFMYSFAEREDTKVVDEPLYAHFLSKTNTLARHPCRGEILGSMEKDGEKVVKEVILGNHQSPIVLFKQMTHHLIQLKEDFLYQTENVLLIRNPLEIIASYSRVIPNPSMQDVGVRKQFELYEKLEGAGKITAVIDARELLLNPRSVLLQLCQRLKIAFDARMLSWKAGPRIEDGIWAKYWYANVHQSTGFKKYSPKEIHLSGELEALAQECLPYYEYLCERSLKSEK